METVLWTPDNTESGSGKGQLETRDGKVYAFTSSRFDDHYYGQQFSLGISLVIIMFITIGPML